MIRFNSSCCDGGVNCDVFQLIDLSDFIPAITNGEALCEFVTMANHVVSGQTQYDVSMTLLDASNAALDSYAISWGVDNDVNTWQQLSASAGPVPVPPATTQIRVQFKIPTFVADGALDGHYADQSELRLIFPLAPKPPPGVFIIVR